MRERISFSLLFPLLAVLIIAAYAGGLGVIFILLYESELHALGPIILGIALVVGVPAIAYLLQQRAER